MMAALGISDDPSPIRATFCAHRAAVASQQGKVVFTAVFVSGKHAGAQAEILETVRMCVPSGPWFVCTVAGVGVGAQMHEDAAVAVALISDVAAHLSSQPTLDAHTEQATSAALRDLDVRAEGAVWMLFDAQRLAPQGLLAALQRQLPPTLPVFGMGCTVQGAHGWRVSSSTPSAAALLALWMRNCTAQWIQAPIGPALNTPVAVTNALGGVIATLDDRRATDVLVDVVRAPLIDDLPRLAQTVFVRLLDDAGTPGPLRPLVGVDLYAGAIAIGGDTVQPRQRLQFVLRSPQLAIEHLQHALAAFAPSVPNPSLVLVARSAGRGRALYGDERHDVEAALIANAFPDVPILTVLSAGELAPFNGQPTIDLLTTTVIALS